MRTWEVPFTQVQIAKVQLRHRMTHQCINIYLPSWAIKVADNPLEGQDRGRLWWADHEPTPTCLVVHDSTAIGCIGRAGTNFRSG